MIIDYKNEDIIDGMSTHAIDDFKAEKIEVINTDNIYLICEKVFYNSNIESLKNLPNLKAVDRSAFSYSNLKEFDFKSVEGIDSDAFSHTKLINANIPNLIVLGKQAFIGSKITTFTAPKLEIIKTNTFNSCLDLKHVEIPICKEIDEYAFAHCKSLRKITLPKTLEKLGIGTFYDCARLEEITFLSDLSVPFDIFDFCPKLEKIYVSDKFVENNKRFTDFYKNKIIVNALDFLIEQNKSFREINQILKKSKSLENIK